MILRENSSAKISGYMNQCKQIDLETQTAHTGENDITCELAFSNIEQAAEEGVDAMHNENEESENGKSGNVHLAELAKELEQIPSSEAKLQHVIDFMSASLAQAGSPHFKSFWQARILCLELFKENIGPSLRSSLWNKYTELSKEARRLKELLDEQSAFAVEQIEMAIQAVEQTIIQLDQLQKESSFQLPIHCKALEANFDYYCDIQYKLDLLNVQASRINSLRKELIKTDMRIRKKNQLFQRLSVAGDKVFPLRKEYIKAISATFSSDVEAFIKLHFTQEALHEAPFYLREEIKRLQSIAKILTLNAHTFTQTRISLSECWDKVKLLEKERKKERSHQKALYKQHVDAVVQKIEEFKQSFEAQQISIPEAHPKLEEIEDFMRTAELGRDEVRFLREQLQKARRSVSDRAKTEEQERQKDEQNRARQKQEKLQSLKLEIEDFLNNAQSYDVAKIEAERDSLLSKIQEANLFKSERQELERLFKPLRDIIADKQEKTLLELSDDDRNTLQQLRELLKQKIERRQEVKDQLENLRKAIGTSGLDISRAMAYNSQMHEEKERMTKLNQGIHEIEQKIVELSRKF